MRSGHSDLLWYMYPKWRCVSNHIETVCGEKCWKKYKTQDSIIGYQTSRNTYTNVDKLYWEEIGKTNSCQMELDRNFITFSPNL
jgi:hypothetical protein